MAKVKKAVKKERPDSKAFVVSVSTHRKVKAFAKERGIPIYKATELLLNNTSIMKNAIKKSTKK